MVKLSLIFALLISTWANASESCVNVDTSKAELKFTGYKFTDKTPVSGTFKNINWFAPSKQSVEDVLAGASLAIETSSIDAGDPARDENITASLFKTLMRGHTIRAVARSVDKKAMKLNVDLFMGGGVRPVSLNYVHKDGHLVLEGTVDLLKLGYNKAFESLAEQCKDLHTGTDGKAKTWSEVAIEVKVPVSGC